MFKIVHEEPEGIDNLPPLYPEELSGILKKMLVKDPQARYQRLEDVVREIEIAKERLRNAGRSQSGAGEQAVTLLNAGKMKLHDLTSGTLLRNPVRVWGWGTAIVILVAVIWYLSTPSAPTGAIALNVLPWAEVTKVESDSTGVLPLNGPCVTPCRIVLPAGKFTLTCTHPEHKRPLTLNVIIQKDSVLELTQQWPGYDPAKILTQF
jgi:hypothetical protein